MSYEDMARSHVKELARETFELEQLVVDEDGDLPFPFGTAMVYVSVVGGGRGPCPECGAQAALPIVYGMPDLTYYERLQGEVVFAGCCVPEDPPAYACGVCGARWGERPRRRSEPLRSVFDDLE